MGQKLIVGPINKGLRNDVTAFNIDNDSFPTLINAYQWRGRLKRKRGTSTLGRLTVNFNSLSPSTNPNAFLAVPTTSTVVTLDAGGNANLLTGNGAGTGFNIQALSPNASIVPGTVVLTFPGPIVFTDPAMDGTLSPLGTINYSTGAIQIIPGALASATATFQYYTNLPVMGLEDFVLPGHQYIGQIAFDTVYSYNIDTASPYNIYQVNFYKNPPVDAVNLPGYIPKLDATPTTWNGQDYQQFWTINYQDVLWATNGINVPFSTTNIGMQFKPITNIAGIVAGPPAFANLTIANHGLVVGDFVFINEIPSSVATGINFQTGYVTVVIDANNVTVEFPFATLAGAGGATTGIAQYLTSRSDVTKDCIRWYDGDPTNGDVNNFLIDGDKGWVNFMPPLSRDLFAIDENPQAQYYLVGARMIQAYKDRLLFLGPVIQSSSGSPIYLPDVVIFSQNGTPFYTSSFTGDVSFGTTLFHPVLVPDGMTATANAWFEDQTGYGGYIAAGIDEPLLTCATNEDTLILGFQNTQTRFVYTGNDILPFNFYLISNELGSSSTFSVINMGKSVMTRGDRGFVSTSQVSADRMDDEIPDETFEVRLIDNGPERICSQRDFIHEWLYWTYPVNRYSETGNRFPDQTLQYNYKDGSWAIFYESYTTYGSFRKRTGYTWATIGAIYPTWGQWNDPWGAGSSTLLQPEVIAGNQQGFVMIRSEGTSEGNSLYIKSFSGNTVTSPFHNLVNGDYIMISGTIGTISQQVNGKVFSIYGVTQNTFKLNPSIDSGTYSGGGLIKKIYAPYIQSKQFPEAWGITRKTRIGVQQYLLTTTPNSQIQLLIFLSQNSDSPYNDSPPVPNINTTNSSLVYSTVLYTCPESTNIGLTPANTNLQMPTAQAQYQTWHRLNTSLIGDTVQVGFTLSPEQLRSMTPTTPAIAITGIALGTSTVVTATGKFTTGEMVKIEGVLGTVQLNYNSSTNNVYQVLSSTPTTVTLNVDSSAFTAYVSGGTITEVAAVNQFAEIEIHGFILDVSASMLLA